MLSAENGLEGLKVFDQEQKAIDLVISDMVMPEMGGLELYMALRERHPKLKMILMSGYPQGEASRELLEKVTWFQKPIGSTDLANRVRDILEGNGNS